MEVVSMHQEKSHLSQLVKRAASAEATYIGAYGHAEAVLVSSSALEAHQTNPRKQIGILAGRLRVPDDIDAPLPSDVLDAFEGN